jgi:hypothetical protein
MVNCLGYRLSFLILMSLGCKYSRYLTNIGGKGSQKQPGYSKAESEHCPMVETSSVKQGHVMRDLGQFSQRRCSKHPFFSFLPKSVL